MPLTVTEVIREFKYGSLTLPDIDPSKTPEQVREHYAEAYPDLTNAGIKGPVRNGRSEVYTFSEEVGVKG